MKRYLVCLVGLLLLFSAYCEPCLSISARLSLPDSHNHHPALDSYINQPAVDSYIHQPVVRSYSHQSVVRSYSHQSAADSITPLSRPGFSVREGITTSSPTYFSMSLKSRLARYPFVIEAARTESQQIRKLNQIPFDDIVLKGGVGKGALIGCLIGIVVTGLFIVSLNKDGWSVGSGDVALIILWGAFNGAGIGGLAGFGRQRKRQRQLNQR